MKRTLKQIMGCFSLALFGSLACMATPFDMVQSQNSQTKQELPNPEKSARRQTNKLKETLNLTDKQYKQIYKLNLKEEKAKLNTQTNQNRPLMPIGQMGNGGDGMMPPMGPPPGGDSMEGGMERPRPSDDMQKQMEEREKKMKKILTDEQYKKWKEIKPEKGERPSKGQNHNSRT